MRIRKFRCIFVFMAILFLFAACSKDPATREVEAFYKNYIKCSIQDRATAIETYVHYEDQFLYYAALADAEVPVYTFELKAVDKLSDSLWLVTAFIASDYVPEGHQIYNYVGIVDDEYRVMVNDLQIPEALKKDIDLTQYIPSDRIPYEDLFLPEEYFASIGN